MKSYNLEDADMLLRMLRNAESSESAQIAKGDWNGLPIIVIVAVGAPAGLLEKYAKAGTLKFDLEPLE